MNYYLQTHNLLQGRATNGELVTGLRSALDQSYSRVLKAASDEWQRRFGGKDPSDDCVSVRITSGATTHGARLHGGAKVHRLGSGAT